MRVTQNQIDNHCGSPILHLESHSSTGKPCGSRLWLPLRCSCRARERGMRSGFGGRLRSHPHMKSDKLIVRPHSSHSGFLVGPIGRIINGSRRDLFRIADVADQVVTSPLISPFP